MRIAVASKDGRVINQHFGHAERFLIYEVTPLNPPFGKGGQGGFEIKFLEERRVEKYCADNEDERYDSKRSERIFNVLKDCQILLVTRIGAMPEKELERIGIKTFMLCDWIEEGIRTVLSGGL
ncbi:MAG: dinitrogenase iron-molybdenum cofactor biosynthesis protein [Deltaproteobacteria bacterium]|nr:dinitrogenase iron-molybdenum cofactor biosynthesis protein [Deltaproteobacteria bacterium]